MDHRPRSRAGAYVKSSSWLTPILLCALGAVAGCSAPASGAGVETGPCLQGQCFDGLSCLSNLCVGDADEEGGDDDGSSPNPVSGGGGGGTAGGGADSAADGMNDGAVDGVGDDGDDGRDDGADDDGAVDDSVDDGGAEDTTGGAGETNGGDASAGGESTGDGAGETSAGSSSDGGDTDGGEEFGPCCDVQQAPGCSDPLTETCVCGMDDYCCATSWDSLCVGQASLDCGMNCPAGSQSCCLPSTKPGCIDTSVQDCVCDANPDCCDEAWTADCVDETASCGLDCGGGEVDCETNPVPECFDQEILDCVCEGMPQCCVAWGALCTLSAALCQQGM